MSLDQCKLINLPKITDPRGNLSVIEGGVQIPFDIKRVYYLYDVPGGSARAGHGHKELQQLIIAMSGSFDVIVDDGIERKKFHLNRSYNGLYIPKMMWREVENFSIRVGFALCWHRLCMMQMIIITITKISCT